MPNKFRVMQIDLTLDTGGLERVVVNLANELAKSGHVDSSICTVGQTSADLIPSSIAPVVNWTELKGPPRFGFKTALRLARSLRKGRVGLIHAHGTQPLVYALTGSLLTGLPVVFTKHNSFEDLDFFRRHPFFQRLACRRVRCFAGVSEPATAILRRVFEPVADRCVTLINGTELPSHSVRQRAAAVRLAGVSDSPMVIVTVCRLAPEKDLGTLLQAFARIRAANVRAELWIVGDGPERGNLIAQAERLGIRGHVRFWGFRGKIQQILSCCDVFVNSSTTEGVSVSILEAMSMGLPVVATAVGGTPSIVKSGGNGLLVAPGQPEQMASALLWLLQDCELRHHMGERSFEQVKEHWSLEHMAGRYLELYQQALLARVRSRAEVA